MYLCIYASIYLSLYIYIYIYIYAYMPICLLHGRHIGITDWKWTERASAAPSSRPHADVTRRVLGGRSSSFQGENICEVSPEWPRSAISRRLLIMNAALRQVVRGPPPHTPQPPQIRRVTCEPLIKPRRLQLPAGGPAGGAHRLPASSL